MDYKNKSAIEKKKRSKDIGVIVFLGCVGCAAVVLGIYNIVKHNFVYSAIYFVAFILSALYTVMKVNTVIPTFIADDGEYIYMRYWSNGFFPFKADKGIVGEFIPDKVKNSKVQMSSINKVYIGSGNFVSRNIPESKFAEKFREHKKKFAGSLKRMEFLHMTLDSGKEKYMPVTDFEPETLAAIVRDIQSANKTVNFMTGNRRIRSRVPSNDLRFD